MRRICFSNQEQRELVLPSVQLFLAVKGKPRRRSICQGSETLGAYAARTNQRWLLQTNKRRLSPLKERNARRGSFKFRNDSGGYRLVPAACVSDSEAKPSWDNLGEGRFSTTLLSVDHVCAFPTGSLTVFSSLDVKCVV
uniref:Uncharacterized protein n=1 Tax=Rhipicephalus zambeziensis TaxID=60191 RepID=A0A224Y5I3_9ACAR